MRVIINLNGNLSDFYDFDFDFHLVEVHRFSGQLSSNFHQVSFRVIEIFLNFKCYRNFLLDSSQNSTPIHKSRNFWFFFSTAQSILLFSAFSQKHLPHSWSNFNSSANKLTKINFPFPQTVKKDFPKEENSTRRTQKNSKYNVQYRQ